MILTMKKFEMPKFEMIGFSADLAFAGAADKNTNVEFALSNVPKSTFTLDAGTFSRSAMIAMATEAEITALGNS